jgi:hypothetical protein
MGTCLGWHGEKVPIGVRSAELRRGVAGISSDPQLVIDTACRATNMRQLVRVAWLPDPGGRL